MAFKAKAVYLALGINMAGETAFLGLWIAQTEGAKFWLQVVTEFKNQGVVDSFIACVDGLKGFPEAIEAVYPQAAAARVRGKMGPRLSDDCEIVTQQLRADRAVL